MTSIDSAAIHGMGLLVSASFKSVVVLLVAWAIVIAARRRSGAVRHLIWMFSVVAVLAAPAMETFLPAWRVEVLPARPPMQMPAVSISTKTIDDTEMLAAESDRVAKPEFAAPRGTENVLQESVVEGRAVAPLRSELPVTVSASHPLAFWLMVAWGAGAIGIGLFGAVGAWIVFLCEKRAREVGEGPLREEFVELLGRLRIRRRVRLLIARDATMPMTWGVWRPRVLLPAEAVHWGREQAAAVLLHELAHVRRWDCATQRAALLACAIYWFNPLVWLAARRMRIERERACDDIVIARGSSATRYAEQLIELARQLRAGSMRNLTAVPMARRSGLGDRVGAILNGNINRTEVNRRAGIIVMIAVLAVLSPLSALHLMRRGVAMAAQPATQPATGPSEDAGLSPLPAQFSTKRVALQVLSPMGQPMKLDSIQSISVWIPEGRWMEGPTPQILTRYSDGWVLVDKQMFVLAKTGQRVDLIFSSGGSIQQVSAKYPSGSPKKITFNSLFETNEVGVDISAGPAAAKDEVAGQVVDPDGKPAPGAVVSFPDPYGARMHKSLITGDDGVFRFSGLDVKQYVSLNVEKTGFAKRLLVNVPVGRGFLVHLNSNTRIKGQLLGSDGLPAANAKIDFVTSKPSGRADMIDMIPDLTVSATADKQGQYDVPLEPGEYEIRVTAANGFGTYEHIQLPSGKILEISKKLGAGANLKIVAVDTLTNKPAAGVKFYIYDRGSGFVISERENSLRTTDANGQAEWDDLMPGDSEVDVSSDVYAQWWTDEMKDRGFGRHIDALEIKVSEGMAPVTVHLEPGVHATGTVVSPDGKPVLGARVNIGGLRTGDQRYAKSTDAQGGFSLTFPGLNASMGNDNQPPKYAMVASDMQHRWANAVGEWFTPSPGLAISSSLKMTVGARLRGRVVGTDGKPVANVQVRVQAADGLDCQYYDPRGMTDEHGRFELGPMRAGNYSIYFAGDTRDIWRLNFPAYSKMDVAEGDRIEIGDVKYEGESPTLSPADKQQMGQQPVVPETDDASWRRVTAVIVPPASQPSPAAVQQPQEKEPDVLPLEEPLPGKPAAAGHLSGQVVDEAGKPLFGASITVWAKDHGDQTDGDGTFSLPSLPKDRAVEIRFSKEGYCPRFIPAQPAGLSGVVVVLTNKTYFEGQVKDASGKPVAGAKIRGDQGQKQADRMTLPWVWTETSSDAQGNYRLYVQPDTYDIQVRMPEAGVARTGKLPIADGQVKHLDINLTAGITFRAHVVDSITKEPVEGVRLWSGQNPGVEGRSDSSGNLVIPAMVPGVINFNMEAKGYTRWWSDAAVREGDRQPNVRNGQFQWHFGNVDFEITEGIPVANVVVEREVTIHGKVIDPDGLPVMGATIGAVNTGSDRSISGDERFAVVSNPGGVFEMKLPASGDHGYNLIVHDGLRRAWRKWANGVIPIFRTKPGQELDNITIALTRPAMVHGNVVDADGKPVAGREVRAIGSDFLEDINYEPSTRTDEKGNFELKFVRPGSQMIQVAPFVFETSLRLPEGTSKTVTLTEGQSLDGVSLTAMPGDEDR